MVFDAKLSKRSLHTILWVKLWILWSCVICTSLLNLSRSFTNPILANLFKKMTLLPPRHLWTTWCQQFLDSKISMYKYHLLQPANAFFSKHSRFDTYIIHLQIRLQYMAWHEIKKTAKWRCLKLPSLLTSFGADLFSNASRKEIVGLIVNEKIEILLSNNVSKIDFPPSIQKKMGFSQSCCFLTFSHPKTHLFTHFVTCTVCCDIRILTTGRMWGDLPTKLFSIHG